MLYRDAHPPNAREKAKARKRSRLSWYRRRAKILMAERRARQAILRDRAWRLARGLGGSNPSDELADNPEDIVPLRMRALMGIVALALVAGCQYSPEHLDALYRERNKFQELIDDVERRYKLQSRDLAKREEECGLLREREEARRAWFASLTPDQRFEWALRQEELRAARDIQDAELEAYDRALRRAKLEASLRQMSDGLRQLGSAPDVGGARIQAVQGYQNPYGNPARDYEERQTQQAIQDLRDIEADRYRRESMDRMSDGRMP